MQKTSQRFANVFHRALGAACVIACFVAFGAVQAHAGEDAPAWFKQAAATAAPAAKDASAVVLLDEGQFTVDEQGRGMRVTRYAVRILTREGRKYAVARAGYATDAGAVRDMRAWLMKPNGEIKRYGKDETIDVAVTDYSLYQEARVRAISAVNESDAGMTFGYEVRQETKEPFAQETWLFQSDAPMAVSRYSLTVPANWRAEALVFNHEKFEPTVTGGTYVWELRNLPPIPTEDDGPSYKNLSARIAVNYFPAANGKAQFVGWREVSRWLSGIMDPQMAATPELTAKARELTATAKTDLDKIKAIGRFVQNVRYVSIDLGVSSGGGYRPHAAAETFAKAYGDCKDKANLMRAMLKTAGVTAYPVAITADDPSYVREDDPSPGQFNHCIIAVKVGDDVSLPTVTTHPGLGRLLFFDPTSEHTPLGDLPKDEQGSLALIVAGDAGGLARMPSTAPEANHTEYAVTATLTAEGAMQASIVGERTGQAAVNERAQFKSLSADDYRKSVERRLARLLTGVKLNKVETQDGMDEGRFRLTYEISADNHAQLMQRRLFVFNPSLSPVRYPAVAEPTRKLPLLVDAQSVRETVRWTLPDGFAVDELPDPVRLESPYGTYSAKCTVNGTELVYVRRLVVRGGMIPVEEYGAIRKFFGRVGAAEQTPVVLVRR
jgi:transglutaminase-like putative cysteine protease